MKVTVRDNHRRDFSAYIKATRCGLIEPGGIWGRGSHMERGPYSALESFASMENIGKLLATRHPRTLRAALSGKRAVNFWIKMLAEDYYTNGGWTGLQDDIRDYCPVLFGLPWAALAVRKQAQKLELTRLRKVGSRWANSFERWVKANHPPPHTSY